MYDPMTVAHEIYLGPKKTRSGRYRSPIITIWHVDPEKHTKCNRSDDSCGWFSPPYTEEEKVKIDKLIKDQYSSLLSKKMAYEEGKSYARVCYNQDCLGTIYWLWRAMKNLFNKKVPWQYGKHLTNKEFQYIYQLATNPVDNFQYSMRDLMKPGHEGFEAFKEFSYSVYRAFRGFYRPWYKHPRWHIRHWKIVFHPWRDLKRRYWDKCSVCGKRGFKGNAYSDWDGTKIWHEECHKDPYIKLPKEAYSGPDTP